MWYIAAETSPKKHWRKIAHEDCRVVVRTWPAARFPVRSDPDRRRHVQFILPERQLRRFNNRSAGFSRRDVHERVSVRWPGNFRWPERHNVFTYGEHDQIDRGAAEL